MVMRPSYNYMPPEQFTQVLQAIPRLGIRKWKDHDIGMLFKICYWCGLRINEGIRLKAEDFDLDMKRVHLGITKTTKGDKGTIPDLFLEELSAYLLGKHGSLFPDLTYIVVYYWLKRLGKMLDIPAWTTPQKESGEKTVAHIYRKSIGKDMLYGTHGDKIPLNIIQKKLRHSDLNTTSQYLKVGDEDVAAVGW